MIVAHPGIVLFFFDMVTSSIFLFAFFPAIAARICVEEKALLQVSGHAACARKRKRLVPARW